MSPQSDFRLVDDSSALLQAATFDITSLEGNVVAAFATDAVEVQAAEINLLADRIEFSQPGSQSPVLEIRPGPPAELRLHTNLLVSSEDTLTLDASSVVVGGQGRPGSLTIAGSQGQPVVALSGQGIRVNGPGEVAVQLDTSGRVILSRIQVRVPAGTWPNWVGGTLAATTVELLDEIKRLKTEVLSLRGRVATLEG